MNKKWIIAGVLLVTLSGCSRSPFKFDEPRTVFETLGVKATERLDIASTDNGAVYLLAADAHAKKLLMAMSHDGGDDFMPPVAVSPDGVTVNFRSENGPSLLVRGMRVYALWQQNSPEHGSEIVFAQQARMGEPFLPPVRVLDKKPDDRSYNGFSSMAIAPNGDIYVVWLDGRDPAQPQGTFSVYVAKSVDGGKTFGKNVRIAAGACPCCRPSVAVNDDGTLYVAWRKVFDGDVRDIVVASSHDGGNQFSAPVKAAEDNWVLHACPDSGPTLRAAGGWVAVAWFSEGGGRSGLRFTRSRDGAQHFEPAKIISGKVADPNHPAMDLAPDGSAMVAFQGRDHRAKNGWGTFSTYAIKIDGSGNANEPILVPGGERSSYPVVRLAGLGKALIGWTRDHDENGRVMLARVRF